MFSFTRIILSETYQEIYGRGLEYYKKDRSKILSTTNNSCSAIVKGTDTYTVQLGFRKIGSPKYDCSCQYMVSQTRNKNPCKHIIATSLAWDVMRKVSIPDQDSVGSLSIAPSEISHKDLQIAYGNPLQADLKVIRIAADELGTWSRPHARLPDIPKVCKEKIVSMSGIKNGLAEIRLWSHKSTYDLYFCAGEMVAAFCELVRWAKSHIVEVEINEKVEIIELITHFHKELIFELIDDSEGLHIFTEAHADDLIETIMKDSEQFTAAQHTKLRNIKAMITEY
ncbi:MAG: SWIM zinc finger family protein [Patescibacteria group bacterium]